MRLFEFSNLFIALRGNDLYQDMNEFASNLVDYVECSTDETSDYQISNSELSSLIYFESSQLSLLLKTDPETSDTDNLVSKFEIMELLTTDFAIYASNNYDNDSYDVIDTVYDPDYTIAILNTINDTVYALIEEAIYNFTQVTTDDVEPILNTLYLTNNLTNNSSSHPLYLPS